MRVVLDTGVLISGLIRPQGAPGQVLLALRDGRFTALYSTATILEVVGVLGRPTFRRKYHVRPEDIAALVDLVRLRGELVAPVNPVSACRDPKDDKFLEVALSGEAECIVSGDADLLTLDSFAGVRIVRPAEFLAWL